MGLRNSVDSATEFLNSCPPPSSMLPSITSGGMTDAMTEYGRDHPTRIDDVYESLVGVEIVITSHPTSSRPLAPPFYDTTITFHPQIYDRLVPRYSQYQKEIIAKQGNTVAPARGIHVNENTQGESFCQGYRLRCAPSYREMSEVAMYTTEWDVTHVGALLCQPTVRRPSALLLGPRRR